jgi:LmbE family N-acetylglucosaminyl deacetylase
LITLLEGGPPWRPGWSPATTETIGRTLGEVNGSLGSVPVAPSPLDPFRRWLADLGGWTARRLPPDVLRAANLARGIDTPRLVRRPPGDRVVVVAPHPDDEVIGAGGTLRLHLAAGADARVVHVTSGERSTGLAGLPPDQRGPTREAEAVAAAGRLGLPAEHVVFLRRPDGAVGDDLDAGTEALVSELTPVDPDVLYVPSPLDAHPDHTATARLVGGALASLPSVRTLAVYEVWSPIHPTHLVDVTGEIDAKLAALAEYRSALTAVDYLHTARGMAAYRSGPLLLGQGYAEAFLGLGRDGFRELLDSLSR